MAKYVLLFALTVAVVELFLQLPLIQTFRCLIDQASQSLKTIRSSRISDHWKEAVMPVYAYRMMKYSLLATLWLIVIFSPLLAAAVLAEVFNNDFSVFLLSTEGGLYMTAAAIGYLVLRRFATGVSNASGNYSRSSRVLHQMALSGNIVPELTYDLEQRVYHRTIPDVRVQKHVFVAGLARSGSTILMRKIYDSGQFCSLTYADMPFVLAPNLWCKITSVSSRKTKMQERAHGDGLNVDIESPEALEEVFWRVFCGDAYIRKKFLIPMQGSDIVQRQFVKYVESVLRKCNSGERRRYLSKNNNNILRLSTIASAFPSAVILIPFRSPLQHAHSLLEQHKRFTERQKEDQFERRYMDWLVHHEFGLNHKPFIFGDGAMLSANRMSLDYWLELWVSTYGFLLENHPQEAVFVSYEELCTNQSLQERINSHIGVQTDAGSRDYFRLSRHNVKYCKDHDLYKRCERLHERLLEMNEKFLSDAESSNNCTGKGE